MAGLQHALDLDPAERRRAVGVQCRCEHAPFGMHVLTNSRRVARSVTSTKSHGWDNPTLGAACAAVSTRSSTSSGIGAPVNSDLVSRRRNMTS